MMWGSTQVILSVAVGVAILQGTFCEKHILQSKPHQDRSKHVNFVLLGATGNLAQKYLWQGLYDLFTGIRRVDEPYAGLEGSTVAFYGGARAERQSGEEALKDILKNNIQYESVADGDAFAKNVAYVQLKTCEHYETFCRDVLNKVDATADQNDEGDGYCYEGGDCSTLTSSVELGRVFYLAVTPYSYEELAECIQRVCRPPDSRTWLRLVLEKPYGSDLSSVNALTSSLLKHYSEEEVYLVDHYLGKVIAKQMLPFRYENRLWLEPLLNNEFVDRIEIVIKEKEDAEGRLNYYDTYGVFLDILQNHGMEMLTLVAMDLPQNLQDTQSIRQQKERFLKSVSPVNPRNIVAGQYRDYVHHGKMQFKDETFNSSTATFGAVLLQISNPRWRGVPIFLVSGKALGKKSTYIRAIFKDSEFHLGNIPETSGFIPKELVFTISQSGVGDVTGPSIALSNNMMDFPNYAFVGCPFKKIQTNNHIVCLHEGEDKAYSSVVSNVVLGRRDSFVGLQQLTSSWNMWGLAISHLTSGSLALRLYDSGDEDKLKFVRGPFGLAFADDLQSIPETEEQYSAEFTPQLSGRKTVVKPTLELMETVSHDLLVTAQISLKDTDAFHLAFPGGRTSKTLFHYLTSERLFPWDRVHVWLVDERCVPSNHQQSNFLNLEEQLLAHSWVPHSQVHPMPVNLAHGLCDPKDNGSLLYEKWLKHHLNDGGRLEAVVLGVGVDGHIASLFPGGSYYSEKDDSDSAGSPWVILTESPPGLGTVTDRMTLSLRFLLQAKKLLVVITGKDKHGVVEALSKETQVENDYQFPVGLLLGHSDVTLYIDDDAFHG